MKINPNPGEGYRFLKAGETIEKGDELFDNGGHKWEPRACTLGEPWLEWMSPTRRKVIPAFDPAKPVRTRDGQSARIICGDRNSKDFPIVALIGEDQIPRTYSTGGCYSSELEASLDLVNYEPVKPGVEWTPASEPPANACTVLVTCNTYKPGEGPLSISECALAYYSNGRWYRKVLQEHQIHKVTFWRDINWGAKQ